LAPSREPSGLVDSLPLFSDLVVKSPELKLDNERMLEVLAIEIPP